MASNQTVLPRQDSEFTDDVEKKVHESSDEKLGYVDTVAFADDIEDELRVKQVEELEVCFFSVDSYLTVEDDPPVLITPDDMLSQACRFRLIHRELRELNPGDTELQTDPKDSKTGDLRIGYSEYVC